MTNKQGNLFVISGPSGVGKDTICAALRKANSELVYSISATTRLARQGEVDGVDYFFKSKDQFISMIERDELLEWAEYAGNYYGTPAAFVREQLAEGRDVLLEIEVQGALKIKERFPEGVFIFLLPPSLSELQKRIEKRGTETEQTIAIRMEKALEELRLIEHYDYAVVNDKIQLALENIQAIFTAEHCKQHRILPTINQWIAEVK